MKNVLILLLLLCNIGFVQGQGPSQNPAPVTSAWFAENLEHITLELYYTDPWLLTRAPVSVDDIKKWSDVRVTVDGETLGQHKELIVRLLDTPITTVDEQDSYLDARVYYALCDDTGKALFDVAMWGRRGEIFVNGIPCEEEDVFYNVALEFLPPDTALTLENYLERDGVFEIPRRLN